MTDRPQRFSDAHPDVRFVSIELVAGGWSCVMWTADLARVATGGGASPHQALQHACTAAQQADVYRAAGAVKARPA